MTMNFKTPILLIIFNRPSITETVFGEIKKLKPAKLFIAADGPRNNITSEKELCEKTREIIKKVDWPCEVKTLLHEKNLGILHGPHTAISWFFDNVEEGIILEDDCLPNQSFFSFCESLLEHYRNDERIMQISGDNFQEGIRRGVGSYYFSKFNHLWGWATWKRAWKLNDIEMRSFPLFRDSNRIRDVWDNKKAQKGWVRTFEKAYSGQLKSWDYQWLYTFWSNSGLCILPNLNLVKNIGFGNDATHTKSINSKIANLDTKTIDHIVHPTFVLQDKEADEFTYKQIFYTNILKKVQNKIKHYYEM